MQLQTVETKLLSIAYERSGPEDGRPLVLLHGWPDDARTWTKLLPTLHAAGFRTYAPFLRGCGPTRFLRAETARGAQFTALAQDLLDFADALGLGRFALVGHDWGARAAYVAAALWPERIEACVALSTGWGTNHPTQTLSMRQTQNYWYQWLMATERGAAVVRGEREQLTRHIWQIWNPGWRVPDGDFAATRASFDNPDWADITLHSYRVRWGNAPRDPACDALEARLEADPIIRVPTLTLHGASDPVSAPESSAGKEALFAARYERKLLPGLGHFPQREQPQRVAREIIEFLRT